MDSVYIKVPVSERLPTVTKANYRVYVYSNQGLVFYDLYDGWEFNIEWWLDEICLPTEEEIKNCSHDESYLHSFQSGANFILDHIKKGGDNNEL